MKQPTKLDVFSEIILIVLVVNVQCLSCRPRVMRLEKESYCELGVEVTGGNLVGIYVKEMTADSVCKAAGLRVGDRLFKVNLAIAPHICWRPTDDFSYSAPILFGSRERF